MEDNNYDNNLVGLIRLFAMVRNSRDLWFLNDAAELSEKLYKDLSGKPLTREALRLSKIGTPEEQRKSQLAFKYRLAHQSPETIEELIGTEGAYITLASDLTILDISYKDCVQNPSLLIPKEMDKVVFEKFADSYDNLLFYDTSYVTMIYDIGDGCMINRVCDKTQIIEARTSKTTIAEGDFTIHPTSQAFKGSVAEAVDLVRAEQEKPNLIITGNEELCFYVLQRYINMRMWEDFKTSVPLDKPAIVEIDGIEFIRYRTDVL